MRLCSALLLALLGLTTMATTTEPRRHGCCTAFSKLHAVSSLQKISGSVTCAEQTIKEGCNINAVIVTLKKRKLCVDPTRRKMRRLLKTLCAPRPRKPQKTGSRQRLQNTQT